MHRSRIGVILVDVPDEQHTPTLAFWAGATGEEPQTADGSAFTSLGVHGGLRLEFQRTGTGTPARVHLDIETDDVDAEVARLVAFGAGVQEHRDGWTIMRDPAGLVFCVVPVWTGHFDEHATTWPDAELESADEPGSTTPPN